MNRLMYAALAVCLFLAADMAVRAGQPRELSYRTLVTECKKQGLEVEYQASAKCTSTKGDVTEGKMPPPPPPSS
jgi:hypothetical protein